MTLESAERLVEKILQQLQIKYEVSGDSAPHHDHDHGGDDHPEEKQRSLVVDAEALPKVPAELHPFVSPRAEPKK